eukprot:gnl/TRDRNA2_/TRDRNA2_180560_c0_seq1.p1 gnl/TRDRNA2_/TRDRNA2_180560_c0~~gnl/TRDRNA2_/TRDRNA2_180560_c0_seq1.p1  ORF type:complete len:591 (+),score=95.63 gnl/TRDRNA2_/TRDRNA2_180560_c0_seq1:51-1823(+)
MTARFTIALAALLVCAAAISHEGTKKSFLRTAIANGTAANTANEAPPENKYAINPLDRYPVPTSIRCVINICIQYMIVMLILVIVRTWHEIRGTARGVVEAALTAAANTMAMGPMICVLLLAVRLHVNYISKDQGDPQVWVQYCMYGCTNALMISTCIVLTIPLVIGKVPQLNKDSGDLEHDMADFDEYKCVLYTLMTLRYCVLVMMYGSLLGVILGIFLYVPPEGTWPDNKVPPPAPAPMCTVIMSVAFFSIFMMVYILQSISRCTGRSTTRSESVMYGAARSMELAPMLAILFLAARMRALQMGTHPQPWAQVCFYTCTFALMANTLVAIIVPLMDSGEMDSNSKKGMATQAVQHYQQESPVLGYVLLGVRIVIMTTLYVGVLVVIASIFLIQHPDGAEKTVPVSPAVQCVINLTVQFFIVYLMVWIMITMQQTTGVAFQEMRFYSALEAARATVAFCPMLAILFVATRLRALMMTDNKGAPQPWAQDGMFLSTWATLISLCMCLLLGLFVKVEADEDGNVVNKFEHKAIAIPIICIRYFTMLLMYTGIVIVIVSAFLLTPETANGRGSSYVPRPASAPPNTALAAKY